MKFFVLCAVLSFAAVAFAFPLPNEPQVECILTAVHKMVEENPNLEKWHADAGKAFHTFAENLQKCNTLSGAQRDECYKKVETQVADDYARLLKDLPENVRDQFDNSFKKCFQ